MSSPGDRPADRPANRILVTEPVAEEGLAALRTAAQIDVRRDLSTDALAAVIGDYDGLIVRSGTRVNADVIAAADRLRVIGRAGAGVDNIDVDAATQRGILVLNVPGGNTVSAAELAVGLLLALSRHLAAANASLRSGAWERQQFVGSELRGEPAMQAVNAPFIDPETLEVVGPYLEVASMCGRLCTQLVRGQWRDVRVHYRGEIANHDVTPLKAAVVAGLLAPISDEHVNLVSVNNVIAHRGWRVAEETRPDAEPYQATVTVELTTSAGGISLTGTLEHGRAAVVEIDGLPVHIAGPRAGADHLHLLVLRNEDRPGRIGAVGGELGRRNVNIHAMDVGHDASDPSADALMAVTIDRALTPDELNAIAQIDGIDEVHQATM